MKLWGVRLIIINSVGPSNWGATDPQFAWLDMEKLLYEKGIFHHRSVAASAGGSKDVAANISSEGRMLIEQAIARNNVAFINEPTLEASRSKRMEVYEEWSTGSPIAAYVNVGGGVASMGPLSNREFLVPGLNMAEELKNRPASGIILTMAQADIPVIHLLDIRELAGEYGLPVAPVPLPRVGEGRIYRDNRFEGLLAALALVVVATSVAVVWRRLAKRAKGANKGQNHSIKPDETSDEPRVTDL